MVYDLTEVLERELLWASVARGAYIEGSGIDVLYFADRVSSLFDVSPGGTRPSDWA